MANGSPKRVIYSYYKRLLNSLELTSLVYAKDKGTVSQNVELYGEGQTVCPSPNQKRESTVFSLLIG